MSKRSILKRRKRMGGGGFTATMKQTMIGGGGGSSGSSSNSKRVVFTNKISINETFASDMYKRYNKAVTQYSLSDPKEINKIKNELNYYKCNEMLVHESSQNNTHFFLLRKVDLSNYTQTIKISHKLYNYLHRFSCIFLFI